MVKNVIFDLGNVLIGFDKERIARCYTDGADCLEFLLQKCFGSPEWVKLDLGEITAEEAAAAVAARENGRYNDRVRALFCGWFENAPVNEAALGIAHTLKAGGRRIFILSNMHLAAAEYFERKGLFDGFDGTVISALEHMKKPDRRIFRLLLDRYGLKAGECLFVDDDDTGASYDAARNFGFLGRAVRPNDAGDVEAELKEFGIM